MINYSLLFDRVLDMRIGDAILIKKYDGDKLFFKRVIGGFSCDCMTVRLENVLEIAKHEDDYMILTYKK